MNKSDDKLNLLKDIGVFEYVSGEQSAETQANFEKMLSDSDSLQNDVATEKQLRNLLEQSQESKPVEADNINSLLDRIDAQATNKLDVNTSNSETSVISFSRPTVEKGLALAACLLLAIFVSINMNNQLLEPKFQTLSSSTTDGSFDLNTLASEGRLLKFELASSASSDSINSIMVKYELQLLSLSLDGRILTVKSINTIDTKQLSLLESEQLVRSVELIKFN